MSRRSFLWTAAFFVLAGPALSGCASLVHGVQQQVGFTSSPSRAKVFVDSQDVGLTPVVAMLERKTTHVVKIELDGFQPFEARLTRRMSAWALGNVFTLGIGLLVDLSTGAVFNLTPDLVTGQLAKQAGSNAKFGADAFYLILVQHADSNGTRVGTLRRQ